MLIFWCRHRIARWEASKELAAFLLVRYGHVETCCMCGLSLHLSWWNSASSREAHAACRAECSDMFRRRLVMFPIRP